MTALGVRHGFFFAIPIFQLRNLRPGEAKIIDQGHLAGKWQTADPGSLSPGLCSLSGLDVRSPEDAHFAGGLEGTGAEQP